LCQEFTRFASKTPWNDQFIGFGYREVPPPGGVSQYSGAEYACDIEIGAADVRKKTYQCLYQFDTPQ